MRSTSTSRLRIVDGPVLQSDPEMVKYAGQAVPLRATGTLSAPSVLPDFAAVVRARVTQNVNREVEQQKAEVQQRVDSSSNVSTRSATKLATSCAAGCAVCSIVAAATKRPLKLRPRRRSEACSVPGMS